MIGIGSTFDRRNLAVLFFYVLSLPCKSEMVVTIMNNSARNVHVQRGVTGARPKPWRGLSSTSGKGLKCVVIRNHPVYRQQMTLVSMNLAASSYICVSSCIRFKWVWFFCFCLHASGDCYCTGSEPLERSSTLSTTHIRSNIYIHIQAHTAKTKTARTPC